MNEAWQQIIRESLERGVEISKGPVPGAKLRQIVAKIAPKFGEVYPPEGTEKEKFRDFLGRFSSIVTVLTRGGQDILVAPADKPELLTSSATGQAQLRDDIFEALTHIPKGDPPIEPWYDRDRDQVVWAKQAEIEESPSKIKMPVATFASLSEDRRAFAISPEIDPQVRDQLFNTLREHTALGAFSTVLKENGLAHKWHFFRFRALVSRLRSWCEEKHVDWRDDWLNSRNTSLGFTGTANINDLIDKQRRIEGFLESLSPEDLKRISVPLDIVLKYLRK